MSKTAHTPGPWKWTGTRIKPESFVYLSNEDHQQIGACIHGFTENEANARLIAAAPTLLCMLQRVMDEICMTEAGMSHVALLTLEQARVAITAAEGSE